jgi:hypothetical protein
MRYDLRFGACVGVWRTKARQSLALACQRRHRIAGKIEGHDATGHSPSLRAEPKSSTDCYKNYVSFQNVYPSPRVVRPESVRVGHLSRHTRGHGLAMREERTQGLTNPNVDALLIEQKKFTLETQSKSDLDFDMTAFKIDPMAHTSDTPFLRAVSSVCTTTAPRCPGTTTSMSSWATRTQARSQSWSGKER